MGDFNDTLSSLPVRIVMGMDTYSTFEKPFPGKLFSCHEGLPKDQQFSILYLGQGDQIDHILVSGSLRACLTGSEIMNQNLRDHGVLLKGDEASPTIDSDHAPVIARFKAPSARS
jgi:exonuclease III